MGTFFCPVCKKQSKKTIKDGEKAKSCSSKCYGKIRTGSRYGPYKRKIISKKYVYIYSPDHPNAICGRGFYVAEHRLVMEKNIGRYLKKNEIVHHKDGRTMNNDISNLQLMTAAEHNSHHSKKRKRKCNGQFTA